MQELSGSSSGGAQPAGAAGSGPVAPDPPAQPLASSPSSVGSSLLASSLRAVQQLHREVSAWGPPRAPGDPPPDHMSLRGALGEVCHHARRLAESMAC